jgi:hypothetical protein
MVHTAMYYKMLSFYVLLTYLAVINLTVPQQEKVEISK